jgi:16S rRNA (guanine527-N7)-methyltransferase
MPLDDLIKLSRKNIKKEQINALPNGLICLKGGELQNEISKYKNKSLIIDLKNYFKEDFFDTKKVVYVPI